jgi:phosphate:Na+ symporter
MYLYPQAMDEAQSALDLVEREQARLIRRLPLYLDPIRDERSGSDEPEAEQVDLDSLQRASVSVASACNAFLAELTERTSSHSALERIVNLQSRNDLIIQLQESCVELTDSLQGQAGALGRDRLRQGIAEGLHALLDTLAESLSSADHDDVELLRQISRDRSSVMERIRADLLASTDTVTTADKHQLLNATSLVERITWLVRRYAKLLQRKR